MRNGTTDDFAPLGALEAGRSPVECPALGRLGGRCVDVRGGLRPQRPRLGRQAEHWPLGRLVTWLALFA
jgi:hypothetical protein